MVHWQAESQIQGICWPGFADLGMGTGAGAVGAGKVVLATRSSAIVLVVLHGLGKMPHYLEDSGRLYGTRMKDLSVRAPSKRYRHIRNLLPSWFLHTFFSLYFTPQPGLVSEHFQNDELVLEKHFLALCVFYTLKSIT